MGNREVVKQSYRQTCEITHVDIKYEECEPQDGERCLQDRLAQPVLCLSCNKSKLRLIQFKLETGLTLSTFAARTAFTSCKQAVKQSLYDRAVSEEAGHTQGNRLLLERLDALRQVDEAAALGIHHSTSLCKRLYSCQQHSVARQLLGILLRVASAQV